MKEIIIGFLFQFTLLCSHCSVAENLVNLDFWMKFNGIGSPIYGILAKIKDGNITHDNFMEKIDTGMPEAGDSGNIILIVSYFLSQQL